MDDIVGGPLNSWSYTKASLPISLGGLGLCRASLHAPAAYISSISSTEWLISDILDGTCSPPPLLSSAFSDFSLGTNNSDWSSAAGIEFPLSQKNLSRALDEASYTSLLHEAPNQRFKAFTLSTSMPHAGDWLNVIPSPALGLSVEDLYFHHCLQYWLGTPMFPSEYQCPLCSGMCDVYGDHHVECGGNKDRIHRHDMIRDVVSTSQGYTIGVGEDRKQRAHSQRCHKAGISFVPFLTETLGGWSTTATKTISSIGRLLGLRSGTEPRETTSHLFQRLSVTLWRGNAIMWSARTPATPPSLDGQL